MLFFTPYIVNEIITPPILTIIMAVILDLIIGDPKWLYHPVRIIGFHTIKLEPYFRKITVINQKLQGALFALTLIFGVTSITLTLSILAFYVSFTFGVVTQIIMISLALAINSLAKEGWTIKQLLLKNDIISARKRISTIVSRNMSNANERDIIRALIETMTENLSDGVIAPLFFTVLAGAPGIWFYKTINTLDSMIGYKNEQYLKFGWFSAKLDDIINFVPARITGILIIITSFILNKNTILAIKSWRQDAQKGPSPNGGIPIVTFAGAQNIRLGGDCYDKNYKIIKIPHVGGNRKNLDQKDIEQTLKFHYLVTFLFIAFLLILQIKINFLR